MRSIGERFEEARKRKGISVREATEATKLRNDVILGFESDQFDFNNLPEVYIQGFLKLYACFLDLDAEKIITDYHALRLSKIVPVKKTQVQSLGQIPFSAPPPQDGEKSEKTTTESQPRDRRELYQKTAFAIAAIGSRLLNYKKAGITIAAIGGGLLILIGLFTFYVKPSPESATNTIANPITHTTPIEKGFTVPELLLKATEDVRVIVRNKTDHKHIFNGPILKGQQIIVPKTGPVQISFTNGRALTIEAGGKRIDFEKSGPGWISLD